MSRFDVALAVTLREEVGNNPKNPTGFVIDSGGPTAWGIRQSMFDVWLQSHGLPEKDVREATKDEVHAFYAERFWGPARCAEIPAPLDLAHFDAAVNESVHEATLLLQRGAGVTDDGIFGPHTLAACWRDEPHTIAAAELHARAVSYHVIAAHRPDEAQYLPGWLARVRHIAKACAVPVPPEAM